ncbi:MAG: hypothetical protein DHS20C10_04470 [marine bacterium B5-7]|nr:MAG: hypothetical protein DHS20C10_04470 [marine bacterium B5-7]
MLKKFYCFLLLLPLITFAGPETQTKTLTLTPGKTYQVLKDSGLPASTEGKVNVVEFFNYGCPACYHFEKEVEAWLATKPANVHFTRMPLSFHIQWEMLSKAYFVGEELQVLPKLTPIMFDVIHVKRQRLSTEKDLIPFFEKAGANKSAVESAFSFSPLINNKMLQAQNLMKKNKIFILPTFIIAGKYKIDPSMLKEHADHLVTAVRALVNKAQNETEKTV